MVTQCMCAPRALVVLSVLCSMVHAAGEVPKSWHSFDKELAETQRALSTAQANLDALERVESSDADLPEPTYNEETHIHGDYAATYEICLSVLFVCIIGGGSALRLLVQRRQLTRTCLAQATLTVSLLLGGIYVFTNVIMFESSHFVGRRSLTIVESVYLLAQMITTVGYGDILPATAQGQLAIGVYVVFCLLLIMEMIASVTQVVVDRVQKYSQEIAQEAFRSACLSRGVDEQVAKESVFFSGPEVSYLPAISSGGALLVFFCAGILFFHYYPGEKKTWLQAIYMSLVTLSTTGFGAFTADTAGGQVFGAFWMVFGVAVLASFIGAFAELVLKLKARELHCKERVKKEMKANSEALQLETGRSKMDRADFLCFAALQLGIVSRKQLEKIQSQFELMDTDGDGCVGSMEIQRGMNSHSNSPRFTFGYFDSEDP